MSVTNHLDRRRTVKRCLRCLSVTTFVVVVKLFSQRDMRQVTSYVSSSRQTKINEEEQIIKPSMKALNVNISALSRVDII